MVLLPWWPGRSDVADSTGPDGLVAVFGDVGGHRQEFERALSNLGCDPEAGTIPDHLTVIQLGDLVHRGPDSPGCVGVAERFRLRSPDRYIQLLGNHEAHEIGGPQMVGFDNEITDYDRDTIGFWWWTGWMRTAACITDTLGNKMVVTHGGISPWFFELLGTDDADEFVSRLNRLGRVAPEAVTHPGVMLSGTGTDAYRVGPVWAEAVREVYLPWMTVGEPPFGQIHGHSSFVRWTSSSRDVVRFERHIPTDVAAKMRVDQQERHTFLDIDGHSFIGIDPRHGRSPASTWGPLIVGGSVSV